MDLEIQKQFFPDARVTGETTPSSVDTHVNLALTSVHFKGKNHSKRKLEGEVHKAGINWKIKQTSEEGYEISKWGPKFDGALELAIREGRISGTYIRGGPHFDWDIRGTYDNSGRVNLEIDDYLNLGITLNGKVTPK